MKSLKVSGVTQTGKLSRDAGNHAGFTVQRGLTVGGVDRLGLSCNELELSLTRLGGWSGAIPGVGAIIYAAHLADRTIAT
ncbi:hypothetical protein NG799_01115 [Laspinema sp. D1]|uniref:Uncharacterized protein n=1 Tax=Laspinema palackyanum D2a TaxID=2953684 RepID=A0ABT2MJL4_9CYAN|nr:hypothetical protein [Laspinema sp. D2b]MCT7964930.1 hypothetical protein [Laspinema sp. D2a]